MKLTNRVKCDRPPPGSTGGDGPTKDVCTHCRQLGMACGLNMENDADRRHIRVQA